MYIYVYIYMYIYIEGKRSPTSQVTNLETDKDATNHSQLNQCRNTYKYKHTHIYKYVGLTRTRLGRGD